MGRDRLGEPKQELVYSEESRVGYEIERQRATLFNGDDGVIVTEKDKVKGYPGTPAGKSRSRAS